MSAIIAGEKCKGCGKPYYYTLGHPKWYDDVVKRQQSKNKDFLAFEQILISGKCLECYSGLDEKEVDEILEKS